MSIKAVQCPNCRTSANVVATMATTKCQACGTVYAVSGPAATSAAAQGPAKTNSKGRDSTAGSGGQLGNWLIVGGVSALALIGLILITVFRAGGGNDQAEKPAIPMREHATVVEDLQIEAGETPQYRVVDLPESTRKQIYQDYKKMIASSFGKAKKIPKSGVAGQTLNSVLGDVVDNDVTKMALIHGISEEDIAQIFAEGEAQGW